MPAKHTLLPRLAALIVLLGGCSDGGDNRPDNFVDEQAIYAIANDCVAISPLAGFFLAATAAGDGYAPIADNPAIASRFRMRPSDLGKYLLYDAARQYLVSDGTALLRKSQLESDTRIEDGQVVIEDRLQSEGEWLLEAAGNRFLLRHIKSGGYMGEGVELVDKSAAAKVELPEQEGCADFPELTVDAVGKVGRVTFDNDELFGFVETHSHLFSNRGFGGGGAFHGAPFHPLGIEHALPDCDLNHGEGGRKDFIGFAFDDGLDDFEGLLSFILQGELPEDDHRTDGYPTFSDWPAAPIDSTHQVQYFKWIERAYLAGMRLLVQHATTNQVLCELVVGLGVQSQRYDCNDMVAVDRIIEDTYGLERYIDALSGGPGKGWFRIVFSPQEAREQIRAGKLAVILGIETSDLFDCFLVPFGGFQRCTEADVLAKLDEYYEKGVRVLFPVHKLDNDFSAGDGDRRISEIGNFGHTGYYNNFIECPPELLTFRGGFDDGGVNISDLNRPRDVYDAQPPPVDMSGFAESPLGALSPFLGAFDSPPLVGEYCQNHGLTELGEFLLREMMKRGMVIEVDHLPRKGYKRAYDMLVEYDYPAAGTHGRTMNGLLYELGGVSKSNLGRCRDPDEPATMDDGLQARIQVIRQKGGYPAEGFGFDLNGFAGAPGPRFGEKSGCSEPQDDMITYPFTSYAGDVTFERPAVGNRVLDFNTEGMVHLGLVAELIEDVRRDGVNDEELEPLFKSAEGYLRMWEKAERRAVELSSQ